MDLNTIEWGSGERTALLLHGVTSNAEGWWRLGPAIEQFGYRVVAADLRGHGLSPRSDDHRIASHAADVAALGASWDVVVGHSMGGAVATVVAAANPSWTDRLVLEDPAILFPDLPAVIGWLLPDFEGPLTAAELQERNPAWDERDAAWKAEALRQCGPDVVELAFTQTDPWDFTEEVASLAMATMIIGAEPGRAVIPTEFGELLAASNPNVTFTQLLASHSMHRDAWEDFWALVRPLL